MLKVFAAPQDYESVFTPDRDLIVFLAGSIEMGKAIDWQQKVIQEMEGRRAVLLNPRRTDWDSSWKQEAANAQFSRQVNWELQGIEDSDHVFFYFQEGTLSPISLLEFGLCVGRGTTMTVVAEPGFWRRGNLEVMAERDGYFKILDTLEEGIAELKELFP